MGILDFVEEAAGAFAAEKALEAVDPDAGVLAKGAAIVAGFEGVKALKEHFAGEGGGSADADADADTPPTATDDRDAG